MQNYTIGKLAKESQVGVETVRFYQRKGLLRRPSSKSGFRQYSRDDVSRIRFIKRAQEVGFTLREVEELLALNGDPKATCGDVRERTELKINEIQEKIDDLNRIKAALKKIERACEKSKREVACCRITDCFEGKC